MESNLIALHSALRVGNKPNIWFGRIPKGQSVEVFVISLELKIVFSEATLRQKPACFGAAYPASVILSPDSVSKHTNMCRHISRYQSYLCFRLLKLQHQTRKKGLETYGYFQASA